MIPEIAPYNNYTGDGTTTQFDFDFYIEDASQLVVQHTASDGTIATLTKDTDYSIYEVGNKNGSYIVFPLPASTYSNLSSSEKISLMLKLPISQQSEYGTSSELDLENVEYSFDYLTRIAQIQDRQLERAIKVQEGSNVNTDTLAVNLNKVADISSDVSTVADNASNINTVAGSISNVNTVAGIASDVSDVAAIASDIDAVASDLTNIDAVAGDLTNIDAVAGDLTNIDAASGYAASAKQYAVGLPSEPTEGSAKYWAGQAAAGQVQSDWSQSDNTKKDYIKNKPNFKTINNNSIVGSGNINIDSLPSQTGQSGKFLTTDGTAASWGDVFSRNIGEIVASTIPLTDAGLHLLDGTVIQGSGIYSAFVDYIASIYDASANYFCTEVEWQQSVTDYGVCGKFVYDSVNNTVRLPLIEGFTESTIDATVLGDLTEAGLPNITGRNNVFLRYNSASGAFEMEPAASAYTNVGAEIYTASQWINFDASRSSSIYGNSTTVQPQSIKVLYYIVIATSTKTDIEVDIDEIATDLNQKVDKSQLVEADVVVETYQSGTSWYRLYSSGWCEQGGTITNAGPSVITLLKNYINTDYSVEATTFDHTGSSTGCWTVVKNKVTSGFRIYGYYDAPTLSVNSSYDFIWETKGYIA